MPARVQAVDEVDRLTALQYVVARLLIAGRTDKQIAFETGRSFYRIRDVVATLMRRYEASCRTELAYHLGYRWALGWVLFGADSEEQKATWLRAESVNELMEGMLDCADGKASRAWWAKWDSPQRWDDDEASDAA